MRNWMLSVGLFLATVAAHPILAETQAEQVFHACQSTNDPAACFIHDVRSMCPSKDEPKKLYAYDVSCASDIGKGVTKLIRSCLTSALQSSPPIGSSEWSIANTSVYAMRSGIDFRIEFAINNEYIPYSSLVISPSSGKLYVDGEPIVVDAATGADKRPAIVERLRNAHVLGLYVSPESYYRDMTPERYLNVPAKGFFQNYEKLEHAFESCGYRISK
jgi:hypothetical protein